MYVAVAGAGGASAQVDGLAEEVGLAGKLGRPVVAPAGWEVRGVERADDPADAVARLMARLGQPRSNAG